MNIALFINSNIGIGIYKYLKSNNVNIKLIVTNSIIVLSSMKLFVKTVFYNKKRVDNIIEHLNKEEIELSVVACFPIIPKKIWDLPKYKTINMHYSLLYSYGGPNPVEWQIHNNEQYTGVSVHYVIDKIDGGKIIIQKKMKMPKFKIKFYIFTKLNKLGKQAVLEAVQLIDKYKTNIDEMPLVKSEYPYSYYSFYHKRK